jgi:AhpD family alkylhydroperoxidase
MVKNYKDLNKKVRASMVKYAHESIDTMEGYIQIHKSSFQNGALDKKTKLLMALAISICDRCDRCIALMINDALVAGASHKEIVETINVSISMGGGPSVVYGAKALQALKEFEESVSV